LEELRYMALGAAVLVTGALFFAPRFGVLGLVLLFPLLTRFIPRAAPGVNSATALTLFALLAGFMYSRPVLPRLKVLAPFAAYYALTLIGYVVLVYSPEYLPEERVYWFQAMKARLWPSLLFFIGFALAPDRVLRERLLLCLVIGLLLHDASGIYDYVTGGAGRELLPGEIGVLSEDFRASGILDANPNILGGHLAAFSVLALMGMLRRESSLFIRGLCAGTYAISGMVLVLTQSRGALLGFLVAHGVWLFYSHRKLLVPATAALIVVGAAGYSASLLPERLTKRIEQTLTPGNVQYARLGLAGRFDSSVNARIAIHLTAGEVFVKSPVWGHGFGSFGRLLREHGAEYGIWGLRSAPSESILLNTAVEAGVIGLLVYGWLFWAILSPGFALIRGEQERELGIGLVSVFAAIFVISLTQIALFLPEISQGLWFMAGMATRAREQVQVRHAA
jgi:O-antigen ligase